MLCSTPIVVMAALANLGAAPQALEPRREALPKFSPSATYDLGGLIDLGLASNPATRAEWFRARAAAEAVGEARAPYFPRLAVAFEGGSDKWYTPAANAPDNFRREQATSILSLEYLLLDFGRRAADVKRTMAAFEAAGLLYERRLQKVVFDIQRAYFAHEASIHRLESAEALLAASREAEETVRKQSQTGLSARPDLLAAQKKLLEAQYERDDAAAALQTTLGDLCVAAGLPANTPLRLTKPELPPSTKTLRESAAGLIDSALAVRPDLAARAADIREREAATRRARADFLPEVRLEGKYAYSTFGYDARAGAVSGRYNEDLNGYGAFLVAKWDLFDGFERISRLKKNRAQEEAAREDWQQSRLDATRDVWTAFQENLSAAGRVEYAEGFVTSAAENFEAVRSAYQNGLATIAEFTDAAGQLAIAKSTRATAFAEYSTSLAALAFAAGQPPVRPEPATPTPTPKGR